MSAKDVVDALLRLLAILISWPVILLCLVILIRRELPAIISKLAERVTKGPFGFEFAQLQQKVDALSTKVEQLEKVTFEPSTALTPGLHSDLQSSLESFQAYLGQLGYKSKTGKVSVFIDSNLKDNVYYENNTNRIVLGEPLANDTDAVFREYTHHALTANVDWSSLPTEQEAVESGLADYFPCSFNNDPLFGEKSVHLFRHHPEFANKPAIRNLKNTRKFSEAAANPEIHHVGEIWGGAFWEMREQLGQSVTDKLLLSTWVALPAGPIDDFNIAFVKKLLETAQSLEAGDQSGVIRAIFKRRGFKA